MKQNLTAVFQLLYSFTFAQGTWEVITPTPTSQSLLDVQFITKEIGWAVGSEGTILKTTDGGDNWIIQHEDPEFSLAALHFFNENEGWAVGTSKILHTTDGGSSWSTNNVTYYIGLTDVQFINDDIGWIVGSYNRVYKTTNGGENWNCIVSGGYDGLWPEDVHFINEQHGVIVGNKEDTNLDGYIAVTEDGGETWTETSPANIDRIVKVQLVNSDIGYAFSQNGQVLKTSDGGYNWETKTYLPHSVNDIHFFDTLKGYALTTFHLNITEDGGESWQQVYDNGFVTTSAFCFIDSIIYTVGPYGDMQKGNFPYESFERMGGKRVGHFYDINFKNSSLGYAKVFKKGYYKIELFKTSDGGCTWANIGVPYNLSVRNFCSPSVNTICAIDYSPIFYKSNDGGDNWTTIPLNYNIEVKSVEFYNEQIGFIGCDNGAILKTTDGGDTWNMIKVNMDGVFIEIQCLSAENIWARNSTNSVFHSIDGGETWVELTFDNGIGCMLFINENIGFVYGNLESIGYLYRTEDGGENWEVVFNYYPMNHIRMSFGSENFGWMKLRNGFYTTDKGKTWTESFEEDHVNFFNDIDFIDEEHGWICGAHSQIIKFNKTSLQIKNHTEQETDKVFPNPVEETININLSVSEYPCPTIEVYNILGELVFAEENFKHNGLIHLNVDFLSKGVYFINITDKQNKTSAKIIKN